MRKTISLFSAFVKNKIEANTLVQHRKEMNAMLKHLDEFSQPLFIKSFDASFQARNSLYEKNFSAAKKYINLAKEEAANLSGTTPLVMGYLSNLEELQSEINRELEPFLMRRLTLCVKKPVFFTSSYDTLVTCSEKEKSRHALTITTWFPSSSDKKNNRTVMDAVSAKAAQLESTPGYRVNVYGHARAELLIDLKDNSLPPELFHLVDAIARENGCNYEKLTSIEAYVSWVPGSAISEERTTDELKALSALDAEFEKEAGVLAEVNKKLFREFLGNRYPARNNLPRVDELKHGSPSANIVVKFTKADFLQIINVLSGMMSFQVENGKLITSGVKSGLKYSGLDLLRVRQEIMGAYPARASTIDYTCTTAVIQLLKAAFGEDTFRVAARRVIEKNPGRLHDIPLVEFVHDLTKEMYLMTQPTDDVIEYSTGSRMGIRR